MSTRRPSRTVFLIGNGVVVNGWKPVRRALRECLRAVPASDPNLAFARQVFHLRWLSQQLQGTPLPAQAARLRAALRQELRSLSRLKRAIAVRLAEAERNHEIYARADLRRAIRRFARGTNLFITTNWDNTIEACGLALPPVLHIHGSISHPSRLYLPSEMVEEQYRSSARDRQFLQRQMGYAIDAVARATRLVIHGLSLGALDVELGMVLSSARSSEPVLPEAVVIDRCPRHVAERLRFFFPVSRLRLLTPADLQAGV